MIDPSMKSSANFGHFPLLFQFVPQLNSLPLSKIVLFVNKI
jgi:hypothetical protein